MLIPRKWALWMSGLLMMGALASPVQAEERKLIVRVKGVVQTFMVGSSQPLNVLSNRILSAGIVKTMADSMARISTYGDQTVLLMGPNTTLDLSEYDSTATRSRVNLKNGSLRAKVHKGSEGREFDIKTNCVLAAQGTDYTVQYINPSEAGSPPVASTEMLAAAGPVTNLLVNEGRVVVYSSDGKFLGELGPGDSATYDGTELRINQGVNFEGVPEELLEGEPDLRERERSTYYAATEGPTGFYVDPIEVTGGPLLIIPGTQSNGHLQLIIVLPQSSSSSSTSSSSSPTSLP